MKTGMKCLLVYVPTDGAAILAISVRKKALLCIRFVESERSMLEWSLILTTQACKNLHGTNLNKFGLYFA